MKKYHIEAKELLKRNTTSINIPGLDIIQNNINGGDSSDEYVDGQNNDQDMDDEQQQYQQQQQQHELFKKKFGLKSPPVQQQQQQQQPQSIEEYVPKPTVPITDRPEYLPSPTHDMNGHLGTNGNLMNQPKAGARTNKRKNTNNAKNNPEKMSKKQLATAPMAGTSTTTTTTTATTIPSNSITMGRNQDLLLNKTMNNIDNNTKNGNAGFSVDKIQAINTKVKYIDVDAQHNDILLCALPRKTSSEINLFLPHEYANKLIPVYNKDVRAFVCMVENDENLHVHLNFKNFEDVHLPLKLFKIMDIDDNILKYLMATQSTSNLDNPPIKELVEMKMSDRYFKFYDVSSAIGFGEDHSIITCARLELKKNVNYIFRIPLNAIFFFTYFTIFNRNYKSSLMVRNDNDYLCALVINCYENCIIETGVKLLKHIPSGNA